MKKNKLPPLLIPILLIIFVSVGTTLQEWERDLRQEEAEKVTVPLEKKALEEIFSRTERCVTNHWGRAKLERARVEMSDTTNLEFLFSHLSGGTGTDGRCLYAVKQLAEPLIEALCPKRQKANQYLGLCDVPHMARWDKTGENGESWEEFLRVQVVVAKKELEIFQRTD